MSLGISGFSRRTIYLAVTLGFLLQCAAHIYGFLPNAINYRVRDGISIRGAVGILKRWHGLPLEKFDVVTGDDAGPMYLMAILLYCSYSRGEIASGQNLFVGPIFFWIMDLAFWVFLLILFQSTANLAGQRFAIAATTIFLISGTANFLAFSGMVYLFPAISAVAILLWLSLLERHPRYAWGISALTALFLYCSDFFRPSGSLLLLAPLITIAYPRFLFPNLARLGRQSAAVLIGVFALLAILKPLPSGHGTSLWNSIHSGLFEYGGWIDHEQKNVYPAFVKSAELPPNAVFLARWSDLFEATVIQKTDPGYRLYTEYKPEYEKLFQAEMQRFYREYPGDLFALLYKRVWRVLVINPWQSMGQDSDIIFQEPLDTFLRALWLLVLGAAICFGGYRERFLRALYCLFPVVLPSILVHSGYMIYNFPFQVVAILLWLASLRFLCVRYLALVAATGMPQANNRV